MENKYREIYEDTVVNMLTDSQAIFYAHIISACKISFDENFPAPAGIYFKGNQFYLTMNPESFGKYPLKERKAILVHEALHIVFNHIGRKKNRRHEAWNVSADISLNQFVHDLPKEALLPEHFNLEPKLAAENYYALLRKKMDDKEISFHSETDKDGKEKHYVTIKDKNGSNTYEIDPHASADNSEDVPQEVIDAVREKIIERATDRSRGSIPGDIQEEIEKMKSKVVDWKKYIRNATSNTSINIQETIKRRNRRFMDRVEVKGFVKEPTSEGVVILDTSGSMDSKFISQTLGEINNLCSSTGAVVKLIQVDTSIKEVKDYDPKKSFKIKGRGGTHLYPAIKYIKDKKLRADFIIVLTDGCIEDRWAEPPKAPVFFILGKKDKLDLNTSNLRRCKVFNI